MRQNIRRIVILLSFLAMPVTMGYISPMLAPMAALERVLNFGFLFWMGWFAASFLFGRATCGWLCPMGGCQEIVAKMSERKLVRIPALPYVRYLITFGSAAAFIYGFGVLGVREVNFRYKMDSSGVFLSKAANLVPYYSMICGATLLTVLLGKRWMCRHLCPTAAYNIIGTAVKDAAGYPSLHLECDGALCVHCKQCEKACTMSLPVEQMVSCGSMRHTECILCGGCVDACRKSAIRFAWKQAKRAKTA